MKERCSIDIWINEERNEKLANAGLAYSTKDALAGMKICNYIAPKNKKIGS